MKKLLTILLAIGLVATFTACDNQENQNQNENNNNNTVISGENNNQENNENNENAGIEDNGTENNGEQSGNEESGEEVLPEEDDYMPSEELQTLVDTLMTNSEVQFAMPGSMKIMLAPTYVGLSEQLFTQYVVDSIVYEPMISPATSSLCIVKVSEDANVADLKQEVIDNCNPRKWICTGAEKCLAIDSGNYILLIMSTPDNCEAMKTAFTEHFGAENVGEALTKDGVPAENFDEVMNGGMLLD